MASYICLYRFPQLFKIREWNPSRAWCAVSTDIIEPVDRESIGSFVFPPKGEFKTQTQSAGSEDVGWHYLLLSEPGI